MNPSTEAVREGVENGLQKHVERIHRRWSSLVVRCGIPGMHPQRNVNFSQGSANGGQIKSRVHVEMNAIAKSGAQTGGARKTRRARKGRKTHRKSQKQSQKQRKSQKQKQSRKQKQ